MSERADANAIERPIAKKRWPSAGHQCPCRLVQIIGISDSVLNYDEADR